MPPGRKPLSKRLRFEVFKRDSFTCQYCGKSAPDVVLHCDHIQPVSKDGSNDILNLVTSCQDCNLGKSNRLLSDDAAIKQRKRQLDGLQERREQLDMLAEWHRSLLDIESDSLAIAIEFWAKIVRGFCVSNAGEQSLRAWISRFGLNDVLESIKIAASQYLIFNDGETTATAASAEVAFNKLAGICYNRKQFREEPHLKDLFHIGGIARNRFGNYSNWQGKQLLGDAFAAGWPISELKKMTLSIPYWSSWRATLEEWAKGGAEEWQEAESSPPTRNV